MIAKHAGITQLAEFQPSKLAVRVRVPLPALSRANPFRKFTFMTMLSVTVNPRRLNLRLIVKILIGLFVVQFFALAAWNWYQYQRFGLTFDFTQYGQAWWGLAHGHLNPYVTNKNSYFYQDHSAFLFWATTPFYFIFPKPVMLMWIQDAALVATELIAFRWMTDIIQSAESESPNTSFSLLATIASFAFFALDPWIYWSMSDDFHVEIFSVLFLLLSLLSLKNHSKTLFLWVALALLSSNLAATYLLGVVVAGLLAGKAWRTKSLAIAATAFGWTGFVSLIHGDEGSAFFGYGYLFAKHTKVKSVGQVALGLLHRPFAALGMLKSHAVNILACISPGGTIGAFAPWTFGVLWVAILENALNSSPDFSCANLGYQNLPEYILVPIGTIFIVTAIRLSKWELVKKYLNAFLIICIFMSMGWAIVWLPKTATTWIRVPSDSAKVLSAVLREIPETDEALISQGVMGDFSLRPYLLGIQKAGNFKILTPHFWVVITPNLGIELLPPVDSEHLILQVASMPNCHVATDSSGVWAFACTRVPGETHLKFGANHMAVPAWTSAGNAGFTVLSGSPRNWYLASSAELQSRSTDNYIVTGDYFYVKKYGHYVGKISMKSSGNATVQLWDVNANRELGVLTDVNTNGTTQTVTFPFTLTPANVVQTKLFSGVWPWISYPPPFYTKFVLEYRVIAQPGAEVRVGNISIDKQ